VVVVHKHILTHLQGGGRNNGIDLIDIGNKLATCKLFSFANGNACN
jgi:hypothetical protein